MINYWAVLVCAVVSMILGFIWYGPLFGKAWARVIGADAVVLEKRKEMQRRAMPLYFVQFILVILQVSVLSWYILTIKDLSSGTHTALSIWLAFIMPTIAGSAMWNNDSAKVSWARFGIQAGYQLVLFIIFGLILSYWI